jgi:hypothetical protein
VVSRKHHAPAALYPPEKDPRYPFCRRLGLVPRPVWTQRLEKKRLCLCRLSNPGRLQMEDTVSGYGQPRIHWISSIGQPTKGCPPFSYFCLGWQISSFNSTCKGRLSIHRPSTSRLTGDRHFLLLSPPCPFATCCLWGTWYFGLNTI